MLFEAGHAPALGVETRHKTRLVSPIRHHSSTFAVGEPAAYATGSPELKAVGPCLAVSNYPITRGVLEHPAGRTAGDAGRNHDFIQLQPLQRTAGNPVGRGRYPGFFYTNEEAARQAILSLREEVGEAEWTPMRIERIEIEPMTDENVLILLNDGIAAILTAYEIVETVS